MTAKPTVSVSKLILTFLFLINAIRICISVKSILTIKRIPTFKDGITHVRATFMSWDADEKILLLGHFLNPLLLFVCLILLVFGNKIKLYSVSSLLLFLFILFEIALRSSDFYGYLMFD